MKYVEFVGSPSRRNVPRWSFYIKSRETVKPEQREELKIRIRTVPTANHLTMPRRLFIVINDGWNISEIVRIGKFYKQLEWEEGSARRGDGSMKLSSVKNPRIFLGAPRTVCLEMPLLAPFIKPQQRPITWVVLCGVSSELAFALSRFAELGVVPCGIPGPRVERKRTMDNVRVRGSIGKRKRNFWGRQEVDEHDGNNGGQDKGRNNGDEDPDAEVVLHVCT
jgi:hypothetical protein